MFRLRFRELRERKFWRKSEDLEIVLGTWILQSYFVVLWSQMKVLWSHSYDKWPLFLMCPSKSTDFDYFILLLKSDKPNPSEGHNISEVSNYYNWYTPLMKRNNLPRGGQNPVMAIQIKITLVSETKMFPQVAEVWGGSFTVLGLCFLYITGADRKSQVRQCLGFLFSRFIRWPS